MEEALPRTPLPNAGAADDLGVPMTALVENDARGASVHEPP